jgi:hypothetical protein
MTEKKPDPGQWNHLFEPDDPPLPHEMEAGRLVVVVAIRH